MRSNLRVQKSTGLVWVSNFIQILFSLILFIVMLSLVKDGAVALAPSISPRIADTGALGGLGLGWLVALVTLNGSAMAATAVVMLSTETVSASTAFGMIHGSRLGAGLFILLVGFLYELRDTNKRKALSTGLQTLLVAQTIHVPAFMIGYLLLPITPSVSISSGTTRSLVDAVVSSPVGFIEDMTPSALWLPLGFVGLIYSFRLFDKSIKSMLKGRTELPELSPRFFHPVTLFTVGFLVTLVTMSVSISLSLLVPLAARGVIQQRHALPYIMGAGVSTFIDTFFAASLLHSGTAQGIVLQVTVWVALVSLMILLAMYTPYERFIAGMTNRLLESRRLLGAYLLGLFLVPLVMLLVSMIL